MTTQTRRTMSFGEQGTADGLRAVPLIVLGFLILDGVTSLVGSARDLPNFGPSGVVPVLQAVLVTVGAAAAMWKHARVAIVLAAVVVALAFILGPSGDEPWLLVITAVTAATVANRWQLALVGLAHVAYAACFGLIQERKYPGVGWQVSLSTLALSAAAFACGLIARWFLYAGALKRAKVRQLERDRGVIRATERANLADDLQSIVVADLERIGAEIDALAQGSADLGRLRAGLAHIDLRARAMLTELRVLLDVLRRDLNRDPPSTTTPDPGSPTVGLLSARHVQLAGSVVFGFLAARAVLANLGSLSSADVWVQALGLLACAVAFWRTALAAGCAMGAIVVSVGLGATGYWDALAVALLCLISAGRFPVRKLWLVALALIALSGLLVMFDSSDAVGHIIVAGLVGPIAVVVGVSARHFRLNQRATTSQLNGLTDEYDQMKTDERNAVARELHDVVAYQVSLTTMLVMATSASDNPRTLAETVEKVRLRTEAAHRELDTMLWAMRGSEPRRGSSDLPVTPLSSATALARRLSENGFRPIIDIDPVADAIDPITQRTLDRIMQEAATNILRYTPAGSTCHYTLASDDTGVSLDIESPLAVGELKSDLSLGWGLRGIRERVDLCNGTFHAGPRRGKWHIGVTLPVVSARASEAPAMKPRVNS